MAAAVIASSVWAVLTDLGGSGVFGGMLRFVGGIATFALLAIGVVALLVLLGVG